MKHCDSELHVTGRSKYIDDLPSPQGLLHAAVFSSRIAHGYITALDTSAALRVPGVNAVLSFDDIPGTGFIGPIIQDEPLFARDEVTYHGQPIAMVIAENASLARKAASSIKVAIDPLRVITCPKEAFEQGSILQPTRVFTKGNVERIWPHCDFVVKGHIDLGGQEHLYLETNRARAVPGEDDQIKVYSSTQNPNSVQKHVAGVLGIPMHKVEVDVKRIGGGFGGKEDQATHWACMAALAAHHLNLPVQLVLNRAEDMLMTGKRHPYKQDYQIGLDKSGRILAYQVDHYQNSGAFMDLSGAVLERSVLHSTNAYAIADVRIRATTCRTNLPPNTAFRGFGAPQAMFALETAIYKAASHMGVDPDRIQERNLITDGYRFHYRQIPKDCTMTQTWIETKEEFDLQGVKESVATYNSSHLGKKKGFASMPVCFGIGFTRAFLNQGSSLVHVYTDGTASLATGGVEMGQGMSTNMIAIAARTLGIRPNRIRWNSTNTSRIANASPSAASSTSDLNGGATIDACEKILQGLKRVAASHLNTTEDSITINDEIVCVNGKPTNLTWEELVLEAHISRVALMAHGFYGPPGLYFDHMKAKGNPFHYYTFGTCLIEVTVDCLRGTYRIDSAKLTHDSGRPINPSVDLGQVEGGLAQGIGWVTIEDLAYNEEGELTSQNLSTYKAPDGNFLPDQIEVRFLENARHSGGKPLESKAVGEPPFMYGIAAYFAIQRAIDAFRKQQIGGVDNVIENVVSPLTPERVLIALYPNFLHTGTSNLELQYLLAEIR